MPEPSRVSPTLRLDELRDRDEPDAVPELAAALREALDDPALERAPFSIRRIALVGASPTFPNAVLVADALAPHGRYAQAPVARVDRATLLATPVLRAEGRDWTVAQVLARAAEGRSEASAALGVTLRTVARVVSDAAATSLPMDTLGPVIAHHTVPSGTSLFVARDAALNTLGVDAALDRGLTLAAALRLVRPRSPRNRVFYEVGDVRDDALLLTLIAASEDRVRILCRLGTGPVLELEARVPDLCERSLTLVVVVRLGAHSKLRAWVDGVALGSVRGDASDLTRLVGRQTIGAGVLGKFRCALFLRELVLFGRALEPASRARVARRFDLLR